MATACEISLNWLTWLLKERNRYRFFVNQVMLSRQYFKSKTFLFSQVTNQMQEKIDDRLSWLTQYLGGTGDKLALITTCLLHAGYFLLATLCVLFLNAPLFTRLVLLIMVPINAWSEIHFQSSLSYTLLSCLLTFALLGKLSNSR